MNPDPEDKNHDSKFMQSPQDNRLEKDRWQCSLLHVQLPVIQTLLPVIRRLKPLSDAAKKKLPSLAAVRK